MVGRDLELDALLGRCGPDRLDAPLRQLAAPFNTWDGLNTVMTVTS